MERKARLSLNQLIQKYYTCSLNKNALNTYFIAMNLNFNYLVFEQMEFRINTFVCLESRTAFLHAPTVDVNPTPKGLESSLIKDLEIKLEQFMRDTGVR